MYRFDCFDEDHCVSDAATVRYCFDSFDEDRCVMLPQWSVVQHQHTLCRLNSYLSNSSIIKVTVN